MSRAQDRSRKQTEQAIAAIAARWFTNPMVIHCRAAGYGGSLCFRLATRVVVLSAYEARADMFCGYHAGSLSRYGYALGVFKLPKDAQREDAG